MKAIKHIARNYSTGLNVLVLFILTNLIYAYMLLVSIPNTMAYSDGMKIPDLMPLGYDADYLMSLFSTLGEEGRQVYLMRQIPADMIYPFLFGISYFLLFAFLLKKLGKFDSGWFYLCLLPLFGGLADYLENFGIIALLQAYPDLTPTLVTITAVCTLLKSTVSTTFFTGLLVALIMLGIRAATGKKPSTPHFPGHPEI